MLLIKGRNMCFASWDLNCILNFKGNNGDRLVSCRLMIAVLSATPS